MLMTMELEIQRNLENLHAKGVKNSVCPTSRAGASSDYARFSLLQTRKKGSLLIFIGLRKEFDGFVQNYNMHSLRKIVNELHAMLKLHEQTLNLPKNNAPALHVIRAGKVQKGKKHNKPQPQKAARGQNQGNGKDPAKDSICHECGETGHRKRNCP
ncbi:zinc finger, CCHC-type containing protein [Tanacetum coccineum]